MRVTRVNQSHEGRVLTVIRLLKYWNKRSTMPSIGSYLLENILLDYYEHKASCASQYVDIEVAPALDHIAAAVHSRGQRPQGNPRRSEYDPLLRSAEGAEPGGTGCAEGRESTTSRRRG